MLPAVVLLFILVPIAELAVIIQVGQALGLLPTLAILIADSIIGAVLLRSQGRAAWRNFNAAIARRRVPAREALDGVLLIFGGALLLTPGFLTDVLGLLLLVPPTRAVARRLLVQRFAGRMVAGAVGGRGAADRAPRRPDVEGHATEVDDPSRRLP